MKKYICLLPLAAIVACSQPNEVQESVLAKVAQEDAVIAKFAKEVRLANFYIPDANDPATNEAGITQESAQTFINKSQFYQNGKLKGIAGATFGQQYKSFLKTNQDNPCLRQFRRETAEEVMASQQSISVRDRAFFTQELIATRSDDVALMAESIMALRGQIAASEQENMVLKAKVLLDQYEQSFSIDLAEAEKSKGTTYRQKATFAINAESARQGLALVRNNRRLME